MLRRAVAAATAAVLAVGALAWSAPSATAATQLTVEITAVELTGTTPSDQVTVHGRVSNPDGLAVRGLTIAIWRSRDPIGDLPSLRQVTGPAPPPGVILAHWPDGSYQTITTTGVAFTAGESAEFTVRASLETLGFDTAGKVYLIGARALGTLTGSSAGGKVGQGQTVLPVPDQPVPVTRLVLLSATPTKLATNVFRNENLLDDLTGRLDQLLTAAAQPGRSWLIDPALYDEVTDLADGYEVRDGDGLLPGTGQQLATAWLERFARLDQRAGARTLFGLPDLTGAAAAADPEVLARARVATDQVTALQRLPLIGRPTGGVYTEALDSYLDDRMPLLAGNALTGGAVLTAPSGRLVLSSLAEPLSAPSDFAARQLALAETLLAGASGQLRVIAEPADLQLDAALTEPWQEPRLLDDLLRTLPQPGGFADASPDTLSANQFEQVSKLEGSVATYRQLAPDSVIPQEADALLTRAVSQAWIVQDAGHTELLAEIDGLFGPAALRRAVSLEASPRFVMSGRTSQFPLTVANNLTEPIRIKVQVDTDNPQRLRVPDSEVVTIAPGQSASITIAPQAIANGVAIAQAYVATESGHRLPSSTQITIEMTELGFVGWVIVLASGTVVLAATALRIWQVRRRTQREATVPAHPPATSPDIERLPSRRAPHPGDKRSTVRQALDDGGTPDVGAAGTAGGADD